MAQVVLMKDKEKKIRNFYPNVFKDEIKYTIGEIKNGDVVDVVREDMMFVGRGYVTEGTSAFVRVLTTQDEPIDKDFIYRKIKEAYDKRDFLKDETNCARVFFSEADGIPGLVIDKFEKYISIQFRNSGVETFRQTIINAVKKYMKPKGIYERSDVENRVHEGKNWSNLWRNTSRNRYGRQWSKIYNRYSKWTKNWIFLRPKRFKKIYKTIP